MKNGFYLDYLLVEVGKIADLRQNIYLSSGDTLELFVGHCSCDDTGSYPDGIESTAAAYLKDIRFCIFEENY